MTESQAWLTVAERIDQRDPEDFDFYLCPEVGRLIEEKVIHATTGRTMRMQLDAHMEAGGQNAAIEVWNAYVEGEAMDYTLQARQDRRVLAALFLSLEAKDEEKSP